MSSTFPLSISSESLPEIIIGSQENVARFRSRLGGIQLTVGTTVHRNNKNMHSDNATNTIPRLTAVAYIRTNNVYGTVIARR